MNAAEKLQRSLLTMAENGERPRCGDWYQDNPWLAEEPGLRAMAARWCTGCPLIVECDAAAVEMRTTFGVWGGRDRTKRERKPGGVPSDQRRTTDEGK